MTKMVSSDGVVVPCQHCCIAHVLVELWPRSHTSDLSTLRESPCPDRENFRVNDLQLENGIHWMMIEIGQLESANI